MIEHVSTLLYFTTDLGCDFHRTIGGGSRGWRVEWCNRRSVFIVHANEHGWIIIGGVQYRANGIGRLCAKHASDLARHDSGGLPVLLEAISP